MRLTFIYRHIAPYHHSQLNALALSGIFVTVITPDDYDGVGFCNERADITLYNRIPIKSGFTIHDLHVALSKSDPDVVLVPGWGHAYALMVLNWSSSCKIPCVAISDSQECDHSRYFLIEKIKSKLIKLFSAGFVAGQSSLKYMVKLGFVAEKLAVGCDVVDNEHFAQFEFKKTDLDKYAEVLKLPKKYFLLVNRLVPEKNIAVILEAYARYCKSGNSETWGLVIVGSGLLQDELLDLSISLNISDRVQFRGAIGYSDIPIYYTLASVFILGSVNEPWGLVVNEAMSACLPVLVSEQCGCSSDLVIEGKNGFCFSPTDVDEISNLMIKVSSDKIDINKMGFVSREIVADWSLNRYVSGMHQVIRIALDDFVPSRGLLTGLLLYSIIKLLSVKEAKI